MSRLSAYIDREKRVQEETFEGRGTYCVNRAWLAQLAKPYITSYLNAGVTPNILEIGCGNANSLKKIAEYHTGLDSSKVTGTSLDHMEGHEEARNMGINILVGIVAEELPVAWENSFNIIMASVVMQWTELDESVPRILRSLKSGGYFLGYDTRADAAKVEVKSKQYADVSILHGKPERIGDHDSFVIQKH